MPVIARSASDEAISAENRDCFAALLRNKMLNPHHTPLDSSFRWNDADDTPVIPGKAAGRDPESRSKNWSPAFVGMTDRDAPLVSASMLSACALGDS
jgi:hypothetical protein